MKTNGYKVLYGLISNPDTKNMKIKAYESLIYGTFSEKNLLKIKIQDIYSYAKDNSLCSPSQLVLFQVIGYIEKQKIIKRISPETIRLVDTEILLKFEELKTENQQKIERFFEFMISSLQNNFEEIFTSDIRNELRDLIDSVVSEIMESYSESITDFYSGKFSSSSRETIDVIIHKHSNKITCVNENFLSNIEKALLIVFREEFSNPKSDFAVGLRLFSVRHLMSKIIEKNPSIDSIKKEFFKETKLFIDTNVLISMLCTTSRLYETINSLIFKTKQLGGKVLISNWTLNEFRTSVDTAKNMFNLIKSGRIRPLAVENEIIDAYYELSDNSKDWIDFISELQNNLNNLIGTKIIEEELCDEPDQSKIDEVECLLNDHYSGKGVHKKPPLITHDSKILLCVQKSRKPREISVGTSWFLTRDEKLRRFERENITALGFYSESVISCDIWFEILMPFIDSQLSEEDISKSFSRVIGISVLPVPNDVVDSYIKHISIQFDLSNEDTKNLKKTIDDIHIRNILEPAILDDDDYSVVTVLKDIIEDKKEKEDYKQTIRDLAARVRALDPSIPKVIPKAFSPVELEQLKVKVIQAIDSGTADEKGKSLEELAVYLFNIINGIDVIDRRVKLEAEEIDIVFSDVN